MAAALTDSGCQSPGALALDRWQRLSLFEIDDQDAEMPFSRSLALEMDWSPEFVQLAINEYKRFILLSSLYEDMVPSMDVDTVWHMHLLYTRSYQRMCREALDRDFLHHEPGRGGAEEAAEFEQLYLVTLSRYAELFGPPPVEVWGKFSISILSVAARNSDMLPAC